MPILYMSPACGHCHKVLDEANALGVALELRSITNPENATALMEHGGRMQVPYLIDEARDASLYESDAIVAHLKKCQDEFE